MAPDNPNYFSDGYGLYEKHPEGYALVAVRAEDERECYEATPGTVCVKRHAFEGQMYIQQVVLPEGVQQIEEEAFEADFTAGRIETDRCRCVSLLYQSGRNGIAGITGDLG